MKGTIINAVAVIIGSLIGLVFNRLINEKIKKIFFQAIGLFVFVVGLQMALSSKNLLILMFSIASGSIIGELLDIETKLNNFGKYLKKKVKSKNPTFIQGFVTFSLVACVGGLGIIGPIEDVLNNNLSVLYTKSMLDGVTAIVFTSALGPGVLFSFISILVYQGLISLLAVFAKQYLTTGIITEMSAAGGLLIMATGINLLEIKKIKIGNMLPSIIVALILGLLIL